MLELVTFICGAAVMVLEMAGARLLAPHLGTSIIVWTALIGVILASLSIGYWLGGKFADKRPRAGALGGVVLVAACLAALVGLLGNWILSMVTDSGLSLYAAGVVAALLLFCPASVLLGMVSPSIIRVKLDVARVEASASGAVIGRFFALSTIGSILGTFLGGYVLISVLGTRWILFSVSGALLLAALLLFVADARHARSAGKRQGKRKTPRSLVAGLAICVVCAGGAGWSGYVDAKSGRVEIDTRYNHIQVLDVPSGDTVHRYMITDPGKYQSAVRVDMPDNLAANYTRYFSLTNLYRPRPEQVLMLGGGGYTVPRRILFERDKMNAEQAALDASYIPASLSVDVVEIDPGMTETARKYFFLQDDPRLHIFHEDARIFLNRTARAAARGEATPYDVVLIDTFNSHYAIPFHLCTVEAVSAVSALLADNGVVAINTIGSINGENGRMFRAIHASVAEVFPVVRVFMVHGKNPDMIQNLIILAAKDAAVSGTHYLTAAEYSGPIAHDMPRLTDDFAPVERYALYDY